MPDEKTIEIKEAMRLIWLAKIGELDGKTLRAVIGESKANSHTELAYGFCTKPATVRHTWSGQGLPSTGKRGVGSKSVWADVWDWITARDADNEKSRGADEWTKRKREAETLQAEYDAQIKQRRAQVASGGYIAVAIAISAVRGMAATLRDQLMDIPRRMEIRFPPKHSKESVADLETMIRNALTAFTERSNSDIRAAAENGSESDARSKD
jgi:phage terminase Nu1 subunit (DNA packaging protein)